MTVPPSAHPPVPAHRSTLRRVGIRLGAVGVIIAILAAVSSRLDLERDLKHMKVSFLSGSAEGNYHAIVDRLGARAHDRHGRVTNLVSEGSVDNLARLSDPKCQAQFALVQDGLDWPDDPRLQLLGRLPRPESVLLVGKGADAIARLADLQGKRIGIGPAGSGVARIAHQLFDAPDLKQLGLTLSNHPLSEQVDLAAKGDLDLAMFVMDEDAPLIRDAVREKGLAVAGIPHLESIAREIPSLKVGKVAAGEYDPVRLLPPSDKAVLKVDTLVLAGRCASRSQMVGMLVLLAGQFPDFVQYNKQAPNLTGLPLASASQSFFANDGPEVADEYAPGLVDIMPPANWTYLVMLVSLILNGMAYGNKMQLYRIDSERVKIEQDLTQVFGPSTTMGDIARMQPDAEMRAPSRLKAVRETIGKLEALAAKSRRYSISMFVPMGQEMGYRYQESLIHEMLAVLRAYLDRCAEADRAVTQRTG